MTAVIVQSTNTVVQQEESTQVVLNTPSTGTLVQTGLLGPISTSADKYYRHDQTVASDTWTIAHYMDKYPSVTIVDSAGDEVEGAVNYLSTTTVVVTFSAAFSGSAFLN